MKNGKMGRELLILVASPPKSPDKCEKTSLVASPPKSPVKWETWSPDNCGFRQLSESPVKCETTVMWHLYTGISGNGIKEPIQLSIRGVYFCTKTHFLIDSFRGITQRILKLRAALKRIWGVLFISVITAFQIFMKFPENKIKTMRKRSFRIKTQEK